MISGRVTVGVPVVMATALAAFSAQAADYFSELSAFKGKQVNVYMLVTANPEAMILEEVGTDYIKLRLRKAATANASVVHYVHFSAISDVRVNSALTSSTTEIRVR